MGYVYRHVRLDKNEVFYIGIGLKDDNYKRANDKHKRSDFWNKIISKSEYKVDIMFEDDDVDVIKEKEKELIKLYGRIDLGLGTLCNLTDGGDGALNSFHTDDWKRAASDRMKGENNPNYGKFGELNSFFGRSHTEETKEKLRAKLSGENAPYYGRRHRESSKEKISKANKGSNNGNFKGYGELNPFFGKKHSDELKAKWSEKRKGKAPSPPKLVLNLETGIFYMSSAEAHRQLSFPFSEGHLNRMLAGNRANKTSCIYV